MSNRRDFLGTVMAGATLAGASARASAAGAGRVIGANDRIRFGLIGAGSRGKEILKAALASPNVEAAAVADVYSGRFAEADKFAPGLKTFQDHRKLLEDPSIDAVLIATPQHLHARHFVDAIAAGKDVYQEKTMAFDADHARRMRNALDGSGRVVQVGLQWNSSGGVQKVRERVKSGELGAVSLLETHHFRQTPYGGWMREAPKGFDPKQVDWDAFQGDARRVPFDADRYFNWRFYWDYSGGNVFENMVHIAAFWFAALDLSIPESVTSTGGNYQSPRMSPPDAFQVTMKHPEKLLFTFTSMFGNGYYGEGRNLLFGTKGTLVHTLADLFQVVPAGSKPESEVPKGPYKNPTEEHLRNFFDCVRSRSEPTSPFELGFRTAVACRMAVESYRRGTTVRWDPATETIV
ncbi:Gfo/Idh/MocA family protein [Paludisphaera mucosa]|uniref:Gfo/Idh/MocA family oxidoreductase n=1 Tax=Paludisphaera mucosa TaxID=3030827 RepID=A0ABT6FIE9_9BACT|nr:Gfo/Idh/MocA family oxidoreductase [Paludisphaera mucosa]MDG3007271.1 Gfo/Idh/MocA family oxidoreductase [Paludisphaera mucosa]